MKTHIKIQIQIQSGAMLRNFKSHRKTQIGKMCWEWSRIKALRGIPSNKTERLFGAYPILDGIQSQRVNTGYISASGMTPINVNGVMISSAMHERACQLFCAPGEKRGSAPHYAYCIWETLSSDIEDQSNLWNFSQDTAFAFDWCGNLCCYTEFPKLVCVAG